MKSPPSCSKLTRDSNGLRQPKEFADLLPGGNSWTRLSLETAEESAADRRIYLSVMEDAWPSLSADVPRDRDTGFLVRCMAADREPADCLEAHWISDERFQSQAEGLVELFPVLGTVWLRNKRVVWRGDEGREEHVRTAIFKHDLCIRPDRYPSKSCHIDSVKRGRKPSGKGGRGKRELSVDLAMLWEPCLSAVAGTCCVTG